MSQIDDTTVRFERWIDVPPTEGRYGAPVVVETYDSNTQDYTWIYLTPEQAKKLARRLRKAAKA